MTVGDGVWIVRKVEREAPLHGFLVGLVVALILFLFGMALLSVTPLAAHAATATIKLSKVTGPPTTNVTINGTGFGSSETVAATFDTSTNLGTATTGSTGSFSLLITIPSTALPGQHSVQVTGQSSGLTASCTFLVNTDWREFGYDETHSNANPYENVLSPTNVSTLALDWSYTKENSITSSPAIVNGVVYIGSNDHRVYALDARTGTRLWSHYLGGRIYSSPAVVNGVVYICSYSLYAFHLPATRP